MCDDDTTDQQWAEQELQERNRIEETLLASDPSYELWLDEMDHNGEMEDSKMPSYIHDTGGGDFEQCPEGTHIAVCEQVINIGNQKNEYQGEVTHKTQHLIRFQIPDERTTWKDKEGIEHEGPMTVSKFYTSSLSEKASLRQHLESWRGRAFTPDELEQFDLFSVLGIACQVSVGRTSGGKAKINAIMALPKGMSVPTLEGESLGYDPLHAADAWDRVSPGIKKMCERGGAVPGGSQPEESENPAPPEWDDDIPF